jgi:glutamate-1-semialdehyde 2,1-aminomutase
MGAPYAILHWPDTEEILKDLITLAKTPMRPITRTQIAAYLAYFESQCTRSKALHADARQYIPGGVQR